MATRIMWEWNRLRLFSRRKNPTRKTDSKPDLGGIVSHINTEDTSVQCEFCGRSVTSESLMVGGIQIDEYDAREFFGRNNIHATYWIIGCSETRHLDYRMRHAHVACKTCSKNGNWQTCPHGDVDPHKNPDRGLLPVSGKGLQATRVKQRKPEQLGAVCWWAHGELRLAGWCEWCGYRILRTWYRPIGCRCGRVHVACMQCSSTNNRLHCPHGWANHPHESDEAPFHDETNNTE